MADDSPSDVKDRDLTTLSSAQQPPAMPGQEQLRFPPVNVEKLTTELKGLAQKEIGAYSAAQSNADRQIAHDRAQMEEAGKAERYHLEQAQPWDAQTEWNKRQTDPIVAFGSLASVFGILASAFTHAPLTGALNASAAAMNAIREGDTEQYKRAYEAWGDNTKLMLDRAKMERDQWKDARDLMHTDLELGTAKAREIAIRFGDQKAKVMMDNGMFPQLWESLEKKADAEQKITQKSIEMNREFLTMSLQHQLEDDYRKQHGLDPKAPIPPKESLDIQYQIALTTNPSLRHEEDRAKLEGRRLDIAEQKAITDREREENNFWVSDNPRRPGESADEYTARWRADLGRRADQYLSSRGTAKSTSSDWRSRAFEQIRSADPDFDKQSEEEKNKRINAFMQAMTGRLGVEETKEVGKQNRAELTEAGRQSRAETTEAGRQSRFDQQLAISQEKLVQSGKRIEEIKRADEQREEIQRRRNEIIANRSIGGARAATLEQRNAEAEEIAKGIEDGTLPPNTTRLYGEAPTVEAILHKRGFNLGAAQNDFNTMVAFSKNLNSERQSNFRRATVTFNREVDRAEELTKELNQAFGPRLNSPIREIKKNLEPNSPEAELIARYESNIGALSDTLTLMETNGYAPTEAAWDQTRRQINADYAVVPLLAQLQESRKQANYRVQALTQIGPMLPGGGSSRYAAPPTPTESDRAYARAHPEVRDKFINKFGIEP